MKWRIESDLKGNPRKTERKGGRGSEKRHKDYKKQEELQKIRDAKEINKAKARYLQEQTTTLSGDENNSQIQNCENEEGKENNKVKLLEKQVMETEMMTEQMEIKDKEIKKLKTSSKARKMK